MQSTSPGRLRRAVRRGAVAVLSAAALVTGGLVAAAAPSAASAPAASTQAASTSAASTSAASTSAAGTSGVHTQRLCAVPARKGQMACLALARTDVKQHVGITPNVTPSGYGPADLQSAYALPAGGSGATVAIVDAQDDPNAEADLATYRSQYGLTACTTANGCFRKVDQNGGTNYPTPDSGWAGEISLDLDMVSAVCPSCHILLVEATSASMTDLGTAVNRAVTMGAKYVSNSYGGGESSSDTSFDSSYFNHPGVAITVSSGDSGYGVEYPAASQYVTAVGGTSLSRAGNARGWTESVWGTSAGGNGAGSGCSAFDPKPTWQTDTGCTKRTVADVSAVADPATGLAVYDTYQASGWNVYGGTSASAPIIAGVYALAGTPGASDRPSSYPYSHTSSLNDVTSGANGSCGSSYLCTAKAGYDGPTGLGTPNGTAAFKAGGGGGGCTPAQLLGNPGFETGSAAPWTASAGVIDNSTGEPAHSGSWKAWLDGYGTTHTDTLSQSVTIPAACASAPFTFYLHIDTAETTTTTAYDTLTVQAGTTTLATYSNLNHNTGYAQKSLSLAPYVGQTITLKFTGTEDSSLQTSFVIDDTAVNVS